MEGTLRKDEEIQRSALISYANSLLVKIEMLYPDTNPWRAIGIDENGESVVSEAMEERLRAKSDEYSELVIKFSEVMSMIRKENDGKDTGDK